MSSPISEVVGLECPSIRRPFPVEAISKSSALPADERVQSDFIATVEKPNLPLSILPESAGPLLQNHDSTGLLGTPRNMSGSPAQITVFSLPPIKLLARLDPLGLLWNPEAGALLPVFYDGCCCRPMYLVHHMEQGRLLAGLDFCSRTCGRFSFGSDAPVGWVSSTGDGWTTALVFGADDPSGVGRGCNFDADFCSPEVMVVCCNSFGAIATSPLPPLPLGCVRKYG
ncbi:hypothetical protein Nepgr_033534 [Nepenthes gracilis]|uniref:Uncharacterized protein n=1 Tax=Nepenthes gracilis TaxID=150966 RepID=A0AAD3TLC7_NEPGR|nr:hypothetical protein Nepgr_033534 [Nepenthes gracilis]